MASSPTLPPPPSISEEELEEELTDVGNKLLKPPSSTDQLLKLLDELGCLLSKVSQEPTLSMLDALQPSMKALMGTEILMHNDTDVKVWVASCISEIARIMAPNAPYSDDEMKKFFQLSIVAVEQLSNTSGRSYSRAVLVLKTLANIRLCVLMLDLELDDLILKMFERFLDIKSLPDALLSDMERIMTLIVEESEERSFELMSVLLKSVKRENQYVSPVSWELGQKVLKNCAGILISDIQKAVSTMGMAYTEFAEIVASICQVAPKTDNVDTQTFVSDAISLLKNDENADEPRSGMISGGSDTLVHQIALTNCQQISVAPLSNSQPKDISKGAVAQQPQRKRGRKPNSLRKEEEGYDNSWVIGISSSNKTPCRGKNARKRSNPSNSSALAGSFSPSEPGKEPKSLTFSVNNVQGASLPLPPVENCSTPENVHSRPQSGVQQKEKSNSSMNADNGLNLLSVSAGDLVKTQSEGTPVRVASKVSGSTGNPRGRRKRALVNTESQGDGKAKRKRAARKSETGDAAVKNREGIIPSTTDGIGSSQEIKTDFPALQLDAGVQKLGRSAPIGHATDKTSDEFAYGGASKDHGEELVGRKIKVWWPADDQFYKGVITGFDRELKKHKVEYVDGDQENLYLRAERWEIVEDEEDSEATEDTRPPLVTSANRFPSAGANSSHPGNLSETASASHKQGMLVRTKLKPDGAGRTKRTLHDVHSKISPAHEASEHAGETSSIPVTVAGYRVKSANAPILTSIIARYGDIAAKCMFTSATVRASMLDVICDIVKRLQSGNAQQTLSRLDAMETELRDAEAAKIEVSWLQQCLTKCREAQGKILPVLREMESSLWLVSKAAERDLAAAQKWAKESESCLRALAVVGKKFRDELALHESKASEWRNPLDELAKP